MSVTESEKRHTPAETVCHFLRELDKSKHRFAATSIHERVKLLDQCAEGLAAVASQWVDLACQAKRIPDNSPHRAEEVFAGPVAALRYLRLLAHSLRQIETFGSPRLPAKAYQDDEGRLRVRLLPTGQLYDRIALFPFTVDAWMTKGLRPEQLSDCLPNRDRVLRRDEAKTVVVLGAGNVSAIPLTDAFTKMFQEGGVILLKMSPVNEYLGPLFEQALQPLIAAGYLRIVFGGAEIGATAVEHDLTDEVHITGSIHSHDHIVWGPPGPEREERIANHRPRLDKPVYSELGSVSPWIFVPGSYTKRQLEFQAENIATSVINNVSFNCVATKVLLTWRQWPQREEFLDQIDAVFARTQVRYSYYPGAVERYRKFAKVDPNVVLDERLPWTLLRDVKPEESPQFFADESFVCILVEVALDAPSRDSFLRQAVDFANERLWGTLCATLTVPDRFRSNPANEKALQAAVRDLRYGAVAINHWPALLYAMMSPPWGGFPGSTLEDAQSGIGFVHNTFMLEGIEKAVLEGPLVLTPKPPWFPSHTRAEQVAWSYVRLYHRPCLTNAVRLLLNALRP